MLNRTKDCRCGYGCRTVNALSVPDVDSRFMPTDGSTSNMNKASINSGHYLQDFGRLLSGISPNSRNDAMSEKIDNKEK